MKKGKLFIRVKQKNSCLLNTVRLSMSKSLYLRLFRQHHPRNDNPNYIIQVGSVFGFIISIENVL